MSTLNFDTLNICFEKFGDFLLTGPSKRRGAPYRFDGELLFQAFIFRLKTALPLRFISTLFSIPLTTLFRRCRRLAHLLADLHERDAPAHEADHLIVDTTPTRVRSTDLRYYRGYKKQRVGKVRVVCCANGFVRSVSPGYPGSVHDKTIWEKEVTNAPTHHTILADRAYAGATGDGSFLQRPIRKNETQFKNDPEKAQIRNRALSLKRVKIEHLFARLKTCRIIHHYFPQKPDTYATVFKTIALIHNQIMMQKLEKL